MIRDIELTNWRAYRDVQLSLARQVTFFVAPNGVGKSSLVEAVRFGLLGTSGVRDIGRAVRGGSDSATVRLTLNLPGDLDVQVTRTLRRSGAATFRASVNGDDVDEAHYLATLRRSWSADPRLLDALIFGPPTEGKSTEFPIRDHIANVFGIQPVLAAASRLKARRADLAARIKSLRDDLSGTDNAIAEAADVVAALEAQMEAVTTERQAAQSAVDDLERAAALAERWDRYRRQVDEYSNGVADLVAEMAGILDVGDRDPWMLVEASELEAAAALESSVAAISAAQVRAATAASASDLLASATDRCPTCLRPMTPGERRTAVDAHGDSATTARTEIEQHEHQTSQARRRVEVIAQFRRALGAITAPTEPESNDPGPESVAALEAARRQATALAELHGGLTTQLQAARQTLRGLRQAASDQASLIAAAREDLLAEITENTLSSLADHYVEDRIEPLAHEIGRRWKLLFGADGLRLGTDGRLSFHHGDIDLSLRDLSGGERATALLVTRLLLAQSVARTSTIWFDEPLEHLDPRRRAAVARTIVLAAQVGTAGQILVTTYEEGLARRLAASDPELVAVTYAVTEPPN